MRNVVVVGGVRTPFVRAGTLFASLSAIELGTIVLRELCWRLSLSGKSIEEVIVGTGAQVPGQANPAKIIAELAGLNSGGFSRIPAYTVQRNCASGMEAISDAFNKIALAQRDIVAVVGTESMSNFPLLYPPSLKTAWEKLAQAKANRDRLGFYLEVWKQTHKQLWQTLRGRRELMPQFGLILGLTDSLIGMQMGDTADFLAREFRISRENQDKFALRSHELASLAVKSGKLAQEIVPVFVPQLKQFVAEDNGIRHNQTLEALSRLRPYFDKKFGTVTAGNSSQITDGAVALILAAKDVAVKMGLPVLGEVVDFDYIGCDPLRMGLGPAPAVSKLLVRAGLGVEQIGLWEINEAFAAQVLSVLKVFAADADTQEKYDWGNLKEISPEKLNVNGGAIALGHPIGATGARLVLTLLKEMERRKTEYGLAALCVGGGQGGAVIVKRDVGGHNNG